MIKRIIQQIVDKLFCLHEYEEKYKVDVFEDDNDTRPVATKLTLVCKKCGNIKQIKL